MDGFSLDPEQAKIIKQLLADEYDRGYDEGLRVGLREGANNASHQSWLRLLEERTDEEDGVA
jgi:flagellar biosynthesis/type III secretory pathway protein FliH